MLPAGVNAISILPGVFTNECPDVRHFPRCQEGIAGSQPEALESDLDDVLALNGIEPLSLRVVQMTMRAALLSIGMLHDEETAVGVLSCHFEIG
jgi:hypothetical protein